MRKVLALVAHDAKKEEMVQLVKAHKKELSKIDLFATQSTGQLVKAKAKLGLRCCKADRSAATSKSAP